MLFDMFLHLGITTLSNIATKLSFSDWGGRERTEVSVAQHKEAYPMSFVPPPPPTALPVAATVMAMTTTATVTAAGGGGGDDDYGGGGVEGDNGGSGGGGDIDAGRHKQQMAIN